MSESNIETDIQNPVVFSTSGETYYSFGIQFPFDTIVYYGHDEFPSTVSGMRYAGTINIPNDELPKDVYITALRIQDSSTKEFGPYTLG